MKFSQENPFKFEGVEVYRGESSLGSFQGMYVNNPEYRTPPLFLTDRTLEAIHAFIEAEKAPEPLKAPEVGQYIRAVYRYSESGANHVAEGEVSSQGPQFYVDGEYVGYMPEYARGSDITRIMSWEPIDPPQPVEPLEFGARVRINGTLFVRVNYVSYPWRSEKSINGAEIWDWTEMLGMGQIEVTP